MSKPSIPKGTRDFLPEQAARRSYIFDTIRAVYRRYGFQPIETPAMERRETLMGKYGEEGDRLLFRIMNSGEKMRKADVAALEEGNLPRFANSLSEKALRYDLTVPFARFVVQHQNDLAFPFRRYQIQPVWRGDRPQRGRYQEFYQCDADVIGTESLLCEVEFCQIIDEVYKDFGFPVVLKLNNRKILIGLAELIGAKEMLTPLIMAIDNLEKKGEEAVLNDLREKGLSEEGLNTLAPLFSLGGSNEERLATLSSMLSESEVGMKGIEEMTFVLETLAKMGVAHAEIEFDVKLARGLDYYTGTIFEVKAKGVAMGSICGGGRYDDLTSIFGWPGNSGVGISFGADRIYDVLTELELFPDVLKESTQLLLVNFGEAEAVTCMQWLQQIRAAGINAELYPTAAKMKKQMTYADRKKIPFVGMVGTNEIEAGVIALKTMASGAQDSLSVEQVIDRLKNND